MIKNLQPRLAEIGKIKIGCKGEERVSKNGNKFRLPQKQDYFTVTTTEKDSNGNWIADQEIMKALGEKTRELDIMMLYDDIDLNFQTRYAFYNGKKCICSGNGETAERISQDGTKKEVNCPCGYLDEKKCKVSGVLNVILPNAGRIGGVYKFRTHGWNSVNNILSSMYYIKIMTKGILANIPLKLTLRPKSTEEFGNVYMANIEFAGDRKMFQEVIKLEYTERKTYNIDIKQLEHEAKTLQLTMDTDSDEDVADEFYPNQDEQVIEEPTYQPELNPKNNSIGNPAINAEVTEAQIEEPKHPEIKKIITPAPPKQTIKQPEPEKPSAPAEPLANNTNQGVTLELLEKQAGISGAEVPLYRKKFGGNELGYRNFLMSIINREV